MMFKAESPQKNVQPQLIFQMLTTLSRPPECGDWWGQAQTAGQKGGWCVCVGERVHQLYWDEAKASPVLEGGGCCWLSFAYREMLKPIYLNFCYFHTIYKRIWRMESGWMFFYMGFTYDINAYKEWCLGVIPQRVQNRMDGIGQRISEPGGWLGNHMATKHIPAPAGYKFFASWAFGLTFLARKASSPWSRACGILCSSWLRCRSYVPFRPSKSGMEAWTLRALANWKGLSFSPLFSSECSIGRT